MSLVIDAVQPVAGASADAPAKIVSDIRIPELDGLRGLFTLFVLLSHYFVEVPNGIGFLYLGWVAVIGFFVLSGYLVGRLIIEKKEAGNFLPVFYLRRVCRTFPTYFLTSAVLLAIGAALASQTWVHTDPDLPAWSYFTFMQNAFMLTRDSNGLHWLSPTWTLALEEQFYIVAPFLFILVPRERWVALLVSLCIAGVVLRGIGVATGLISFAPLVLLPASMDVLCMGMLLAVLVKNNAIDWNRWSLSLRIAPIACLVATFVAQRIDNDGSRLWLQTLTPFFVAMASAFFILMLVKGSPEAARYKSKFLRFFGDISYSVYLTHLAVLGLMHGYILGATPDFATPAQMAVTFAALGVTIALGWIMTVLIEQPITRWGRSFRWG
jgi:peptidoglycan/LPS O-acetylase OafA/YrhL